MSGASGQHGGQKGTLQADMIARRTGRHLLTRQPQTLATKVPLNDLVIGEMKQHLPAFNAIELASLSKRFTKTKFEKQTIGVTFKRDRDDDSWMAVDLTDRRKSVPKQYKERLLTVPIEDLPDVVKSITDEGIIRSVMVFHADDSLKALLQAEKLSPFRISVGIDDENSKSAQEYLVPLMKRLAGTGKVKCGDFAFLTNVRLVEECLAPFTTLQHLHFPTRFASVPQPPLDWLKKAIMANSQLKKLQLAAELYFSPGIDDAVSTIGRVSDIVITLVPARMLWEHVEVDLCGGGQCALTKLALTMPQTGRLKWKIYVEDDDFYGDFLRLGYYFLSLHKTDKTVVVKVVFSAVRRVQELVEDLSHFYNPLTETSIGTGGDTSYRYRVRVGSITIELWRNCCAPEEEEDNEDDEAVGEDWDEDEDEEEDWDEDEEN